LAKKKNTIDIATALKLASANGRSSALASTTSASAARSRASLTISSLWSRPVALGAGRERVA